MTVADRIEKIALGLRARGEPGTLAQAARLLNVAPSTVGRWVAGGTAPSAKQLERINLLYRTVCQAEKGNSEADKILGALLGAAGGSLLGLGMGGILIAAGLGWLVGESNGENEGGV